jgi:hypothetical protein
VEVQVFVCFLGKLVNLSLVAEKMRKVLGFGACISCNFENS